MKIRLKAFTVLEMLINILIMSIIIGMVYFTYSSFAKQVSLYQNDIEEETDMDSFHLQLRTDFFNSEKVVQTTDKSIKIIFYNTSSIEYRAKDNYLLRTQNNNTDSIRIEDIRLKAVTNPMVKEKLIQKLVVKTTLFNEPLTFVAIKKYPTILEYRTYGD